MKKLLSIIVLSGIVFTLSLPPARPVRATPSTLFFTVNSTLDQVDDNPGDNNCHTDPLSPAAGACTLRAAVMEADATSGEGAAISVPAGIYTLTRSAAPLDGADTGDLNLTAPASGDPLITIVGAGAANTIVDAHHLDRVLTVDTGRTAAISGLTLRGGFLTGSGSGGGLLNYGTLTLDSMTIAHNQVGLGAGGGIYNVGTLTVERSTIYLNSANRGGGISHDYPHNLTLVNSTISQNYATGTGGGLFNTGSTNVYNSTIVFNSADTASPTSTAAGGIYTSASGSVFNMRNTLVAGNYASSAVTAAECSGTLYSYGRNLLGEADPSPCTVMLESGAWYALNSTATLGPLQDNGGPTWTHALLAGSNAIDGGDPDLGCLGPTDVLGTDQRGFPRIVGPSCDIGAFEYLPPVAFLPLIRR